MKLIQKITLPLVLLLFVIFSSKAQDKKASIGFGFGGASVSSSPAEGDKNSGFGLNFYLNGMYNINSNISAGLEYNSNLAVVGSLSGAEIKATRIKGILAKGKYLFSEGKTRPYLGGMLGMYSLQPGSVTLGGTGIGVVFEKKRSFGFAPEAGVQLGSFQISTSYHIIGKYSSDFVDIMEGSTTTVETNYNIWQFNIGWNIGIMDN
jgi:hypothetical protein